MSFFGGRSARIARKAATRSGSRDGSAFVTGSGCEGSVDVLSEGGGVTFGGGPKRSRPNGSSPSDAMDGGAKSAKVLY